MSPFVCTASMRKLQDQNESYQTNRAKMAEGMALALEKKDQVSRVCVVRSENAILGDVGHSLSLLSLWFSAVNY